jgi:hypothetical protein
LAAGIFDIYCPLVYHTTMRRKVKPPTEEWIKQILSNDEVSGDQELVEWFMEEGHLSRKDAEKWVKKRDFYLKDVELQA